MTEVLRKNIDQIKKSCILKELGLEPDKYIVISAHREENIDNAENFFSLMNALNKVAETYQLPVIYSTHPRSRIQIDERKFEFHPLVTQLKPFGFLDYNKLQLNAFCVLSDSGTLSEESSILCFPAVLIRTSTERPEVLDKGTIVIGGINEKDVIQSIEICRTKSMLLEQSALPADYEDINISIKVVKIIQSYTGIVNKMVWRKV